MLVCCAGPCSSAVQRRPNAALVQHLTESEKHHFGHLLWLQAIAAPLAKSLLEVDGVREAGSLEGSRN